MEKETGEMPDDAKGAIVTPVPSAAPAPLEKSKQ